MARYSPRCPGARAQDQRSAHIWHEANAAFGHGNHRAFSHDPLRAMGGNADPAAHRDTVHQGNIRDRQIGNLCIEAVFISPELAAIFEISGFPGSIKIGNIAAGTKGAITLRINQTRSTSPPSTHSSSAASIASAIS